MLSRIPKLVDKNFIVGFIIPVLLGTVGILALLRDLDPFRSIYTSMIEAKDFPKLTIVVLLLWAAAILLMVMNNLLYRLLEGYFGPFNRRLWQDRLCEQHETRRKNLRATYDIITKPDAPPELKRSYYKDLWRFRDSWPPQRHLVMPTRFGNVIRAFENYSDVNYGVDSIPTWLRLQGVMSQNLRMMVDDAHAQVDFFVNVWFLAALFTTVAVVRCVGTAYSAMPALNRLLATSWGFALAAIIGLLVCRFAYAGAVERARAWGGLVKSAFDLYLPALAKKMAYELPATASQRRQFWGAVTSSFLYQEPMTPENWPAVISADVLLHKMMTDTDDEGGDDHGEGDGGNDE
jgi:hypothetical protein